MALPAAFLDELRARTPLAAVIGRRVKLVRSGRQWKGCCPFHGEKTPSFYVYEDGFHCFGCGAHGDAIGFVMQSQGASFVDAVEQLAGEAGLAVPQPSPAAAEAERRRAGLHDVLAAAAAEYSRRLHRPEGAGALAYLRGRGLTDATIARFGLGWSGDGRGSLVAALRSAGIDVDQLAEVGLLREGEAGRPGPELFYNRVMFPIRDRKGRAISFGGRILGDGQPKYVNGPETPLFSKRRTLFALDLARDAARSNAQTVAVEGYMDAIVLHQAGFAGAVAPLGTALTEEQLEELWRLSPAPVLCFDGDAAGGRAAARAIELALPLLTAERTLRIASLPQGEDPDTLVRRQGPAAFAALLDGARSISDVLYDLTRETAGDATPEQRAALRGRLEAAAARISDRTLAAEYRRALLDRFFAAARTRKSGGNGPQRSTAPTRVHPRPVLSLENAHLQRCGVLVAIILRHPEVLRHVEEPFEHLPLPDELAALRQGTLEWVATRDAAIGVLDSDGLMDHLARIGLGESAARVLKAIKDAPFARPDAQPAQAVAAWQHFFGFMNQGHLDEDLAAARRDAADDLSATNQRRLLALAAARNQLRSGDPGADLDS